MFLVVAFLGNLLKLSIQRLRQEGLAMLVAIAEDFAEFAEEVHIATDDRFDFRALEDTDQQRIIRHSIVAEKPLWPQWVTAAQGCDHTLVIAPETEGVLAQAVAMLRSIGAVSLNGFGDFLRCASDKWETARAFGVYSVPHPPTWTADGVPAVGRSTSNRWVVKPRDGCGTVSVKSFDSVERAIEYAGNSNRIIQPWIVGRPASIAVIADVNELTILPAVAQDIATEEIFYKGGFGPLPEEDQCRAVALAKAAIHAMPRTVRGFVGLDIILADDPAEDCVLEVNPRVTTSYVGLRRIIEGNLAARIAGLEKSAVRCAVNANSLHWNAAGEVWSNP